MNAEPDANGERQKPSESERIKVTDVDAIRHIASFALRFSPEKYTSVVKSIDLISSCEIAHCDAHGYAILVFETPESAVISEAHSTLSQLDGVLNVNLVYHHMEDCQELDAVITQEEESDSGYYTA
jgi:nitrate reductase NapAB chaperone NapD